MGTNNLTTNCSSAQCIISWTRWWKINAWIKLSWNIPIFWSCLLSNLPEHRSQRTPMSLFPLVATLHNGIKLNLPQLYRLSVSIAHCLKSLTLSEDEWLLVTICCCKTLSDCECPLTHFLFEILPSYLSHLSCPSPNGWCSSWILCTHQPSCCSSRCKYPQSCHLMPQPNTCLLL